MPIRPLAAALAILLSGAAQAAPSFVNGLALDGAMLDLSGGSDANNGRVGFFSDIYYDPNRNEWWGLSDRGPGGGMPRDLVRAGAREIAERERRQQRGAHEHHHDRCSASVPAQQAQA